MNQQVLKLRDIQRVEIENGFLNGQLYNEIEDLIYKIENPTSLVTAEVADTYGGRTMDHILKSRYAACV